VNSLAALIPEMIDPARALVQVANENGLQPRITSTLRTRTEQEKLYRRYLAGVSRYPVAPPGTSAHEYGFAFDMVVFSEEYLQYLGQVWASWGGVWHPSDPIHFEYPGFSASAGTEQAGRSADQTESSAVPYGISVADFLSGFLPGIGNVETLAFFLDLFGVSHSAWLKFLSSPLTTAYENPTYRRYLEMILNPLGIPGF